MANHTSKWSGMDSEFALLGATLQQAICDATQTRNERLKIEAWEFLEICAPTVAAKLEQILFVVGDSWIK